MAETMQTTSPNSFESQARIGPLNVLVIDDEEADRITLARLLRRRFGQDVQIWEAEDGESALEIVGRYAIDVALIDYLLPDMDGLGLLEELARVNPQTAAILLTGQGSEAVAAKAIQRGAKDYLVKRRFDEEGLGRAVSNALRQARLEQDYSRMVKKLRRSHNELDHFVRALSHDMSANFMLLESSFSRLAESLDAPERPDLGQLVAHLKACMRESKRFLDDLVGLARTGTVEMEPGRVDVAAVVEEVMFEQRDLLDRRGVNVAVHRPLPVVWCNELRVKQIITNLVRNAVKHGCDPHCPRITISSCSTVGTNGAADRCVASIRIHDNGPGIDSEFHEEIFLPGRRLPQAGDEGSGMGLAIVKKIVEHYGGSIRVDPNCENGTAMLVSLPILPTHSISRSSSSQLSPDAPGRCFGHDGAHEDQRLGPHQPFYQRTSHHGRS